jgi:hypothetical protein
VNAGPDLSIALSATATLDGTVTDDGQPAPPSLATAWSKTSGPATGNVTFGNASLVDTTASFSEAGTYVLRLTANDGAASAFDEMTVTVTAANQPPTVNAGSDQTVAQSATAMLDGTVTDDGLPAPPSLTTAWSKTSGPATGNVTFGNASLVDTTASFSEAGTYVLRLTANDGAASAFAELTVTVTTTPNAAPTVAQAAAASPNPSTGTTTNLSALGADDGGEPALTYTWSTTGTPPAPVTFSVNGTNAAKISVATFTQPGAFNLRVTIKDAGNLTVTSNVSVTVNRALKTVNVTPATASVVVNTTTQFSAQGLDQFGVAMSPQPSFTWTVTGGGTISGTGLFTAGSTAGGPFTVMAASGAINGTASVTVTSGGGPSGPVAAYSFNAGSGNTVADSSGNNNNGTRSGATWTTAGKYGGALSFDGVNDRINISDSNSLDLTTAMTLEAWVRPETVSGWRTVVLKERTGHLNYALYGSTSSGKPSGEITRSNGSREVTGTAALPLNTWTHLATTYDGANLRLFVNGNQVAIFATTGNILTSSGSLRIGGNAVWGEYFGGLIDEVRIYNRALTAAEIQADMNAPLASGAAQPLSTSTSAPRSRSSATPLPDPGDAINPPAGSLSTHKPRSKRVQRLTKRRARH